MLGALALGVAAFGGGAPTAFAAVAAVDVANFAAATLALPVDPTDSVAQDFTVTTSGTIRALTVSLSSVGPATVSVALYGVDDAGDPSGAALAVAAASIDGRSVYATVPVEVVATAGERYAIVVSSLVPVTWAADTASGFAVARVEDPTLPVATWVDEVASARALFGVTLVPNEGVVPVTVDVQAGTLGLLTEPAAPIPPAVTLTGTDQTTPAWGWPIQVDDATGAGSGWSLSLATTRFVSQGYALPADALELLSAGGSGVCLPGATCTPATTSTLGARRLLAGPESVVFAADAASGLGAQTLTPQFVLRIPGNAHSGTYTSTWTVSIAAGP